MDVREPVRVETLWLSEVNGGLLTDGLWLSEVNGGLLTDGLWLSEVNGALLPVGRGGGRMEPSQDPGRVLLDAVRWDRLAARVSRDVVAEAPELGGLVGSLLGDWFTLLAVSMVSPFLFRAPGASGAASAFKPLGLDLCSTPTEGFRMERVRLGKGTADMVQVHFRMLYVVTTTLMDQRACACVCLPTKQTAGCRRRDAELRAGRRVTLSDWNVEIMQRLIDLMTVVE